MKNKMLATIATMLSLVVFAMSANVVPGALIRMARSFRVEPTMLANISALQFAGFIISTVVAGYVADIFGKKRIFLLACLFTLSGGLVCGLAPALSLVYLGCLLMGFGGGILEGMSSALLSDLYPNHRKLTLNLSQMAYCVGAIGGLFLMGLLLPEGISWRWFFIALALLGLVLGVIFCLSSIPSRGHEDRINPAIAGKIIKQWTFVIPCVMIACYVFTETSLLLFQNPYLFEWRGAPENWAIYSIAIFWGAMTLGRLICAFLPERTTTMKVVAALMGLTGLSCIAQWFSPTWPVALGIFGVSGFLCAGAWPLIVEYVAARNQRYSGTAVGVVIAAGALGCIAAPPVGAMLFQTMPVHAVFPILGVPMLIGMLLAVVLVRHEGR